MTIPLSRAGRILKRVVVPLRALALLFLARTAWASPEPDPFPTVPAEHRHVRLLLENALRYVSPENAMVDPISGYPFEGWNQDPKRGLFLRSFTQLTAIGQWMELLASIVAGEVQVPSPSPEQARVQLAKMVKSLREDQHDPRLSARGLLGNFLDLATGKRLGPLASDVDKQKLLDAFGPQKGAALWEALRARGWLESRNQDREATIHRIDGYGYEHFDGPLAPFADEATRQKLLAILDQRVVMVVFGDNANLSASVAKTIGALLLPAPKDHPELIEVRRELARFLDDQREGYSRLYDPKAGLFDFGWDATRDRLFGWEDLQGNWTTGHMDYFVNEFRAPATFVVLRYGLSLDAIKNLGFKMKSYRMQDGRDVATLAPWEGSAFQALGLGLWLGEPGVASWRTLLHNVVDIEVDFSDRNHLPGFLSESYTGAGAEYSGRVGIAEITIDPRPRILDAASLYTLGPAYTVAPAKIEQFLQGRWPVVSSLFTDHGPWEGYNTSKREPIAFQTTAHTLALILGILGTGSDHMIRYLDANGLGGRRAEAFPTCKPADLLADKTRVFAWSDKQSTLHSTSEKDPFHVQSARVEFVGIAIVSAHPDGVNLSGGRLRLRYRSANALDPVIIALKPAGPPPESGGLIAKEIFTRLSATEGKEKEIEFPLPAMPGLTQIKEVVLTHEPGPRGGSIDLQIIGASVMPIE